MNSHSRLFSPLQIGDRTMKNRIVSSAHGEMLAEGGVITDHLIRYHVRRAEGGVGMIIAFGSATVHPEAASAGNVALWDERNEEPLARLAREVHEHGCLLLAQASHRATRETLANLDDVLQAPSIPTGALKQNYYGAPHVLTTAEIEQIIDNYAAAAKRLARAGFDGIELTSLGSHLMEQFWSPTLNRREDRYGGDFDGRLRFTLEVLDGVHKAVPAAFIIAFRLSADLFTDRLGLSFDDILQIARRLDATGQVDLFDISGGSGFDTGTHAAAVPTDTFAERTYTGTSRAFRKALSAPVLVAGRILNADSAESVLAKGDSDLVALTRALIADPDLPRRVASHETARIRPCIAINEGCRRVTIGRSLACAVNAGVADPALMDFKPADQKRKVAIVGAGPAGMEAARICAERGHSVALYDREERLGGQMHAFSRLARWPHLLGHVAWLEAELARLNVVVHLNQTLDAATLLEQGVDDIVVATGAASALPPEAQPIQDRAICDTDLLEDGHHITNATSVVVYDVEGRLRGARSALLAKERGAAKVTLVVPHDIACENLEPPNRPAIYRDLADAEIEIVAHSHLLDQQASGLRVRDSWTDRTSTIACDLVVFAGYRRAVSELAEELLSAGSAARIHMVGDCRAPRLLRNAVSEGTRIGYRI